MIPCIHILNFYVKTENSANSVWEGKCQQKIGRLYNRGRISVGTNVGKHSLFVWLFVSGIKTVTGRIIRQDDLSSVVRRSSCTTGESFSRRIMRLVSVFILETNSQTNSECFCPSSSWGIMCPLVQRRPLSLHMFHSSKLKFFSFNVTLFNVFIDLFDTDVTRRLFLCLTNPPSFSTIRAAQTAQSMVWLMYSRVLFILMKNIYIVIACYILITY